MPILPDLPKAEAAIIEQTNAFRAANALGTLKPDPQLARAARVYAQYLAGTTIFSHEADGRRPADRIQLAGYKACSSAENLARLGHSNGFETVQLATMNVEGWQNSPGHRRNMLMAGATETGVAIVKARVAPAAEERKLETYIAVQLLARPEALKFEFRVENDTGRTVSYALGAEKKQIEPRYRVTHTLCDAAELAIETQPGGFLSKGVSARYEARNGQVFKLKAGKGGAVEVEVTPP